MRYTDTEPADVVIERLRDNVPVQARGESDAHFEQRRQAYADAVKREQERKVQDAHGPRDAARGERKMETR